MSCSRVGGPQNLAVVAGNGSNHNLKRKGAPIYCLIPHPVLPQHLLLELSVEGWEVGAVAPGEAGEVCLHVRESDCQPPKAGARLSLRLD